jgi:hypothetical protein
MDFKSIIWVLSRLPPHAADVKAVRAVALGPKGQLAVCLSHRRGEGEGLPGELRVLRQKGVYHLLVLLR